MNNVIILLYEDGLILPDANDDDLLSFTPDPFNVLLLTALTLDYETLLGAIEP